MVWVQLTDNIHERETEIVNAEKGIDIGIHTTDLKNEFAMSLTVEFEGAGGSIHYLQCLR